MDIRRLLKQLRTLHVKKILNGLTKEEEKVYNDLLELLRTEIKNLNLKLFLKILAEQKEEKEFIKLIKENEEKLILILIDFYSLKEQFINEVFRIYYLDIDGIKPVMPKKFDPK